MRNLLKSKYFWIPFAIVLIIFFLHGCQPIEIHCTDFSKCEPPNQALHCLVGGGFYILIGLIPAIIVSLTVYYIGSRLSK